MGNRIDDEKLSICCGVAAYGSDCDICPACKDHTEFLTEAEVLEEEQREIERCKQRQKQNE